MSESVEIDSINVIGVVEVDQQVISIGDGQTVIEAGYMQPGGTVGDKNFNQPFNSVDSVTVTHNLNKRPAVTVVDTAGNTVVADVRYVNDEVALVSFQQINSGTIYCN